MRSDGVLRRLRKYRLGFDGRGLLLFLAVMLPNFIWFAVPAPADVLRKASVTSRLDAAAGVCQVLLAALLVCAVNQERPKRRSVLPAAACLCYYAAWLAYYQGMAGPAVLLALSLFPCAAFLLFEIGRGNFIAVIPTAAFSVCHLLSSVINFIL